MSILGFKKILEDLAEEEVSMQSKSSLADLGFSSKDVATAWEKLGLKKSLPEALNSADEQVQEHWVKLAFNLDEMVMTSVAEHSINPQNIESDIRKKLLPLLFKECKAVGAGMDQAKAMVEWVVQITRVGLSGL